MAKSRNHIRYRPVKNRKKRTAPVPRYSPVFTGCPAVELAILRLYQAGDGEREKRFWALLQGLNYALQMQTHVLVPVQLSAGEKPSQCSWAENPIPPERAEGLRYWLLNVRNGQKMLPVFTRPGEADSSAATLGLPMAELPLQQMMAEALSREDLAGMVLNPWGQSAALDKAILRGMLYAESDENQPGVAEIRQGRQLANQNRWWEAEPLFAAAAAKGNPEGMRRLAGCCHRGLGISKDRRKALVLWKKAAAEGSVLAQVALGDYYGAGTARTPGDPGRALMAYRKARAMAELEMDITSWPVVCLRLAFAEAGSTDPDQMLCLLAEGIHGLRLLSQEGWDAELETELRRNIDSLTEYIRQNYDEASIRQSTDLRLEE